MRLSGVGEKTELSHRYPNVGLGDEVRRSHDGLLGLAGADALHSKVQRVHARRACGVNGESWAAEVEVVSETARQKRSLVARGIEAGDRI